MSRKLLTANSVAIALLLVFVTICHATTVQRLTIEDLVKKADSIVQGTVRSSRTQWSSNGKIILTTYTFEVEEAIKGKPGRSIELTTVGGQVGDITLHVAGMPAFRTGERAIVFVERSGAYSTITGLGQGKFTVANGEIFNQVEGLHFPDGQSPRELRMPADSFKKQLRVILGRQ
jgi:hypothetical protein